MNDRVGLADRLRQEWARLVRSQVDAGTVGTRELPFTVVFAVACVSVMLADEFQQPRAMVAAAVLVVLAQAGAAVGPGRHSPRMQLVYPLVQIVALVLFAYGTGYDEGIFVGMLYLPVLNLALQPGRAGVVVGTLAVASLVLLPPGPDSTEQPLDRRIGGLILALCVFLVASGASAVTTRLRAQTAALSESRSFLAGIIAAATEQLVAALDEDGRILLASPGARTLLRSPEVIATGASIVPYFSDAEVREVAEERGLGSSPAGRLLTILGAAAKGRAEHREWTLVRPDGSTVPARVTILPRSDLDEPTRKGYVIVATDITEQRRAERLQDEFIGLVSHELRTPLASILGYVDLMRLEDDLSPEHARQLDVISRNARRLLRLVEDLLLSGQVAAGTFALDAERVDVRQVAEQSVATLRPTSEAAGVTVTVDAPVPVPLTSDAERLDQVIENLVANAIKFSARGSTVTVTVKPLHVRGSAARARIVVADAGVGMSPEDVDRVTTRFFRADSASSRRVRGVGLGLSVTDAIVRAHGGTLTFDSELGKGTTVTVDLPDLPTRTP